jgi:hypothetical protein
MTLSPSLDELRTHPDVLRRATGKPDHLPDRGLLERHRTSQAGALTFTVRVMKANGFGRQAVSR